MVALFADDVSHISSHHNRKSRREGATACGHHRRRMEHLQENGPQRRKNAKRHSSPQTLTRRMTNPQSMPTTSAFATTRSRNSWESHIRSISTRCRVLASLTSKVLGWRKGQLMKVYKTLQLSLLTYAAPGWQPYAVPSPIDQLERCQ